MQRQLLPHQQQILDKILSSDNKKWGLFLDMGLGKTLLSCVIASKFKDKYDNIYIFCPASMIATWEKEIETDHYLKKGEYEIFPYSKVSLKQTKLLNITDRTIIIFDESHFMKNPTSKRSRYFIKLLKEVSPFIISMTGTPDPRTILDLWIQCYLLDAWTGGLSLNYFQFSSIYAVFKDFGHFKKQVGERNRELLLKGFKDKAFFMKKTDVIDLPDKLYELKYYELTAEQKRYLKNLKDDAMSQDEITKDYIMASYHNFLAICSGFLVAKYDETGKEYPEKMIIELRKNPKIDLLNDIIESLEQKQVIIFCSYHKEIEMISSLLNKLKLSFVIRHGKKTNLENMQALGDFVNNHAQVLLATVQSTSVGLTMTNCDTVVYYNNTYDLMHRVQSEDRVHRIGQKNTCVYIDLIAHNAPDHILLNNLKNKKNNMDDTFRLFLENI